MLFPVFPKIIALAFASTLVAFLVTNAYASDHQVLRCVDRAQPLSGTPYDEGEANVRVLNRDPRRLIASWTRTTTPFLGASPISGEVIVSRRSAGGTWTEEVIAGSSENRAGDSWLDTSPGGTSFVSYLEQRNFYKVYLNRIPLNGPVGPQLSAPLRADHPALAVDQIDSRRLFLAGQGIFNGRGVLVISENEGNTWGDAIPFPEPLAGYPEQAAVTIESGGNSIVASWIEISEYGSPDSVKIRVAPINRKTGAFGPVSTIDTILGDFELPHGAATIPMHSITRHGRNKGEYVYLVWPRPSSRVAGGTDVWMSYSRDGGRTWSFSQRVNDDSDLTNLQLFPAVTALDNGTASVAWYDSRDSEENESTLIYSAVVDRDGRTGENIKLTDCPSYPSGGNTPIGDYFRPDSSPSGPVWIFSNIRKESDDANVYLLDSLLLRP